MLKSKFTSILLFGVFVTPLTTYQPTTYQHITYKKRLTDQNDQPIYRVQRNPQTNQAQLTCPNAKLTTNITCGLVDLCPPDTICFRKNGMGLCCGDLGSFCPTNMHAFHSPDRGRTYSWEMTESTDHNKWYNVTHGNESIACPLPFSFAYIAYNTSARLPTDFDVIKPETSKPKVCKKNSECKSKSDEFCGEASNPSYPKSLDRSASNHTSFKFCYKSLNFGFTKIKPIIEANRSGLILCDNNSDCFRLYGSEIFCFTGKAKISHADSNGNVKTMSGVCAVARDCDTMKYVSSVAELSKGNDFCKSNADCKGISECNVFNNTPKDTISMCCRRKNTKCQIGLISVPVKECFSHGDCVSDNKGASMNQWCDEKAGHCCRDDGNRLWACPDGATPLFYEPKCNGYTPSNATSGKCPQESGICSHGHCCPPLKTNDANETIIGEKPYITNVPCNSTESLPSIFTYAFCDSEYSKIVIMGEKGVDGNATVKVGTKCSMNKDCKETEHVCVSEINGEHHCFANPLKKVKNLLKVEKFDLWKYVKIVAIVCVVLFLIAVIIFFVRRWKFNRKKKNLMPVSFPNSVRPLTTPVPVTKPLSVRVVNEQKLPPSPKQKSTSKKRKICANQAIETYVRDILNTEVNTITREFKKLVKAAQKTTYTTVAFDSNTPLNRYNNIKCQDFQRVVLSFSGCEGDYIHANYVGTHHNPKKLIVTQGPLEVTQYSYYSMIIQERVQYIAMICNTIENDEIKCSDYWPKGVSETKMIQSSTSDDSITVRNIGVRKLGPSVIVSTLTLEYEKGAKTVTVEHVHWLTWPDLSIPTEFKTPVAILELIGKCDTPIVVHCSAGIGRSGTLCAIGYMLESLESNVTNVNLEDCVKHLRQQRIGLIQCREQYAYVHRVLIEHLLEKYELDGNEEIYKKWVSEYCLATGTDM